MTDIGRRFLRRLRSLIKRDRAYVPVVNRGLVYDPDFVRGSFRPGERVNPFAATIEEFDA